MTDPDVGAKTFAAVMNREATPHELAQLIQRRLEHLPEAVAESERYRVLPASPSACGSSAMPAISSASSPATATEPRTSSSPAAT